MPGWDMDDDDEEEEAARRIQQRYEEEKRAAEKARKRQEEQKQRKLSKATFDTVSWPFPDKYKNKNTIRVDEVVKLGIPRKEFVSYLSQEMAESESCRSMPFAVCIIILYACSATAHENSEVVYGVQTAIEMELEFNTYYAYTGDGVGHKSLHDISSFPEFWSWMYLGYAPKVFSNSKVIPQELVDTSTTTPEPQKDPQRGMFLNYNRIMGGVRIMKKKSTPGNLEKEHGCDTEEELVAPYGSPCVGGRGHELRPEKWEMWKFGDAEETEWLYAHEDLSVIKSKIEKFYTEGWMNNETTVVQIDLPVYNAEFGMYTLTKVSVFFSRGGYIWKDISSYSCFADWWPRLAYIVVDVSFVTCIAYIAVKELLEARLVLVTYGPLKFLKKYLNFWNSVDWIAVLAGAAVVVNFRHNYKYTNILNEAAIDLSRIDPYEDADGEFGKRSEAAIIALEDEIHYAQSFRYAMAAYPLVVIMRIFKAFSAQARLAVVTDTIVYASVDLFHFMIVFVSVFSAFCVSGVTFFGRDFDEFSTPARAFNQLFRALMGDLDWEKLRQAGRYEGMLFLLFFRIMMSLVMINLLISMIMDAYNKTKAMNKGAEMIWEELGQEIKMRIGKGKLIPFWRIVNALQYDATIDRLKRCGTHPRDTHTTFLEVTLASFTGKVTFDCYKQYPNMEKLCTEVEKAVGSIVVCDGRGKYHDISDGETKDFPVLLDDRGRFFWYFDTEGKNHKSELLTIVQDAERGNSAAGMVNVPFMKNIFQEMSDEQATSIIEEAIDNFYTSHHKAADKDDLRNMVLHLDHRTNKCLRAVCGERKHKKVSDVPEELQEETIDPSEPKGTVGMEMNELFVTTQQMTSECDALLDIYNPERNNTVQEEHKDLGPAVAQFEELHVGDHVKLLNDMRRVISACFDAGLSVENSEIRKKCVGCHGEIVNTDEFDKTVCVFIVGIGKLWFAPGAFVSPVGDQTWAPPLLDLLEEQERVASDARDSMEQMREARLLKQEELEVLRRREDQLDLEWNDTLLPTAKEADDVFEELRKRTERQRSTKARAELAIIALEKKQARLLQEDRAASSQLRQDREQLRGITDTRNDYFDTMRSLLEANQNLRQEVEEQLSSVSELHAIVSVDVAGIAQYEKDVKQAISDFGAARDRARKEDQTELVRLAGRADSLLKLLKRNGLAPDATLPLLRLRDTAAQGAQALLAI